ncbi:MAG: metal ABC transporter permease [Verrucomicrobiales bacterium]
MMEALLIPFHYEYMIRAMWVSALIGGVCGFLSGFVTLKGWSLLGDALSHAVVPGVAIAYLVGAPFALGAFCAGLLATGAMAFVKLKTRVREDAVIGVVFTAFFALGALLISVFPAGIDLKSIVLGNILGISTGDIWQIVVISAVTLLVLALKWHDLVLYCFDANQARTLGFRVTGLHLILLTLLSATTVAALQTVGAALVIATLVTPGATAYLLTDRFGRMLWLGGGIGTVTSALGAYASYFVNGAPGGCIVTLQTLVFLGALFLAPKHGMLANRNRGRDRHQAPVTT